MRNIIRKAFVTISTIGFWYLILPDHYLTLILYLSVSMIIAIPVLAILNYCISYLVIALRKRYTWARKVFINPR